MPALLRAVEAVGVGTGCRVVRVDREIGDAVLLALGADELGRLARWVLRGAEVALKVLSVRSPGGGLGGERALRLLKESVELLA